MRPAATALLALGVIVAAVGRASADEPEPRKLFVEKQFPAAAAGYEARWKRTGHPAWGVNAVIAWRAAGRYAHALVLLDEVAKKVPAGSELAPNVQVLGEKLASLTATIELPGLPADAVVKIDGLPPEKREGVIVAEVGARDLLVRREGCRELRQRIELLPTERKRVVVELICDRLSGNLHVTMAGVGGEVWVDDERHVIPVRDVDLPLAPGPHRLVVTKMGVPLVDETIEIEPQQTTKRRVRVPWRGRRLALTMGALTGAATSSHGDGTLLAGVSVGFLGAMDRNRDDTFYLAIDFGAARNFVEGLGEDFYIGMTSYMRFAGPIWSRRSGDVLVALDLDPISFRMSLSARGSYWEGTDVNVSYYHLTSATLSVDWPLLHMEVVLWPAGVATWDMGGLSADRASYSAGLTLLVGWAPLGF